MHITGYTYREYLRSPTWLVAVVWGVNKFDTDLVTTAAFQPEPKYFHVVECTVLKSATIRPKIRPQPKIQKPQPHNNNPKLQIRIRLGRLVITSL